MCKSDNYTFLGNCPPTPPLRQHGHVTFCGLRFAVFYEKRNAKGLY